MDLHCDGDYAAYYFAGNDETPFGDCRRKIIDAFEVARSIAGAAQVVIHLSSGLSCKGGRYKIATVKPYQQQREGKVKPKNWEAIRMWLESEKTLPGTDFRVVTWLDREADDGAAAAARYAWQGKRHPAIFSRDKDWRMIPGRHVDWMTLARTETTPDTFEAFGEDGEMFGIKWFFVQMLAGDGVDNIPGLEGIRKKGGVGFRTIGDALAKEALADAVDARQAFGTVRALYQDYYAESWADRFVEQAALLWLRADTKADPGDFMRAIPAADKALAEAVHKLRRRIR